MLLKLTLFCLYGLIMTTRAQFTADDLTFFSPSQNVGLTEAEKQKVLDLHNIYREKTALGLFKNKPTAANMKTMKWNPASAQRAQEWANNCTGGFHGNHPNEGQNFAAGSDRSVIVKSAFKMWNDNEADKWIWTSTVGNGSDYFPKAAHFTQVVWANTDSVGCGYNHCPDSPSARFVCNYSPPGNVRGQKPYEVGHGCSKCPSDAPNCDKGALCTASTETRQACLPANSAVSTVDTMDNIPCYFPFIDEDGNILDDCAYNYKDKLYWCPTTCNYPENKAWSECLWTKKMIAEQPDCKGLSNSVATYGDWKTENGTDPNGKCHIPFVHKGKCYRDCITIDSPTGQPWCSTRKSSVDKKFTYCPAECRDAFRFCPPEKCGDEEYKKFCPRTCGLCP